MSDVHTGDRSWLCICATEGSPLTPRPRRLPPPGFLACLASLQAALRILGCLPTLKCKGEAGTGDGRLASPGRCCRWWRFW